MDFKEWAKQRFKNIKSIGVHKCSDGKIRTVVYLKTGQKGIATCEAIFHEEDVGVLMAYIKAVEKGTTYIVTHTAANSALKWT